MCTAEIDKLNDLLIIDKNRRAISSCCFVFQHWRELTTDHHKRAWDLLRPKRHAKFEQTATREKKSQASKNREYVSIRVRPKGTSYVGVREVDVLIDRAPMVAWVVFVLNTGPHVHPCVVLVLRSGR